MRIRFFSLHGIRGLDGLSRDLPRAGDSDVCVVRGGYGRGKTTFLDTIAAAKEAVADYGSPDARWSALIGSSSGAAKVRLDWELSEAERARAGVGEALLSAESILGKALGEPERPRMLQALLSQRSDSERGSVHYLHDTRDLGSPLSHGATDTAFAERLTTRNSKFAELFDVLDQPERAADRTLGAARFSELFPKLEIVGLRRTGITFVPSIRHRDTGTERSYHALSASERHAFLFALYTAKAPIVDSVVLIDAPEAGFGDEGAVDLVQAMLRWTRRTQLIVATASRAVAAMAGVSHVVELP